MDDLSTRLRTASDDQPPTRIDLDRLVAGERRRRSRLTVAAAFLVVVATVTAVAVWRPGSAPVPEPMPPAVAPSAIASWVPCVHQSLPGVADRERSPRRQPTEPHDTAAGRLTAALPALLPAGAHASKQSVCGRTEVWWNKQAGAYQATTWLSDGDDEMSLLILIGAIERGATTPACLITNDQTCERTDAPDGSVSMADLLSMDTNGHRQRSVTVTRPDDTWVSLVVIGREAALPSVPLLSAIGRAPELTLYP